MLSSHRRPVATAVSRPFQIVGVDIMELPNDVLVFQDFLTKWPLAFPMPDRVPRQCHLFGVPEGVEVPTFSPTSTPPLTTLKMTAWWNADMPHCNVPHDSTHEKPSFLLLGMLRAKEALSLIFGVSKFHAYLYGYRPQTTPLHIGACLQRWALKLSVYIL